MMADKKDSTKGKKKESLDDFMASLGIRTKKKPEAPKKKKPAPAPKKKKPAKKKKQSLRDKIRARRKMLDDI